MEIKIQMDDSEVEVMLAILGYKTVVFVDDGVGENGGPMFKEVPNPVTPEQYLTASFNEYKSQYMTTAIEEQIKVIAKDTEQRLLSQSKEVLEDVKEVGIESINEVLKSKI